MRDTTPELIESLVLIGRMQAENKKEFRGGTTEKRRRGAPFRGWKNHWTTKLCPLGLKRREEVTRKKEKRIGNRRG